MGSCSLFHLHTHHSRRYHRHQSNPFLRYAKPLSVPCVRSHGWTRTYNENNVLVNAPLDGTSFVIKSFRAAGYGEPGYVNVVTLAAGTWAPTSLPSLQPSMQPSALPTNRPVLRPTPAPSDPPTPPTPLPVPFPSRLPTGRPTPTPNSVPTGLPVPVPTAAPSAPSFSPTPRPNVAPGNPTLAPHPLPTPHPTALPTLRPVPEPSAQPTQQPTPVPTHDPTFSPTKDPTFPPSPAPTSRPTPSPLPTLPPKPSPTQAPTPVPTHYPSAYFTVRPTIAPWVPFSQDDFVEPSVSMSGTPSGTYAIIIVGAALLLGGPLVAGALFAQHMRKERLLRKAAAEAEARAKPGPGGANATTFGWSKEFGDAAMFRAGPAAKHPQSTVGAFGGPSWTYFPKDEGQWLKPPPPPAAIELLSAKLAAQPKSAGHKPAPAMKLTDSIFFDEKAFRRAERDRRREARAAAVAHWEAEEAAAAERAAQPKAEDVIKRRPSRKNSRTGLDLVREAPPPPEPKPEKQQSIFAGRLAQPKEHRRGLPPWAQQPDGGADGTLL